MSLKKSRTAPQVMVISSEGLFQAYNIDLDNGGECSLMKEFAWVVSTIPSLWTGPDILSGYWAMKTPAWERRMKFSEGQLDRV